MTPDELIHEPIRHTKIVGELPQCGSADPDDHEQVKDLCRAVNLQADQVALVTSKTIVITDVHSADEKHDAQLTMAVIAQRITNSWWRIVTVDHLGDGLFCWSLRSQR